MEEGKPTGMALIILALPGLPEQRAGELISATLIQLLKMEAHAQPAKENLAAPTPIAQVF
jgi:hypothetical protein